MKALAAAALVVALQQQQCDVSAVIQGKTQEGVREWFPDAEVMNVLPCVLSIETHVANVTPKLITEVAKAFFSSPQAKQLTVGMELAGYNYFVLGFTRNTIIYDRYGGRWYVFDSQQTGSFLRTAPNYCAQR